MNCKHMYERGDEGWGGGARFVSNYSVQTKLAGYVWSTVSRSMTALCLSNIGFTVFPTFRVSRVEALITAQFETNVVLCRKFLMADCHIPSSVQIAKKQLSRRGLPLVLSVSCLS